MNNEELETAITNSPTTKELLGSRVNQHEVTITDIFRNVEEFVCARCRVTPEELRSQSRIARLIVARTIFIYSLKEAFPAVSWVELARYLNRTHASVINLHRRGLSVFRARTRTEAQAEFVAAVIVCMDLIRGIL